MKRFLTLIILLSLMGCATQTQLSFRYPGSDTSEAEKFEKFKADWAECIAEANKPYVPIMAEIGAGAVGLPGPRTTLFKDCMEKRGYTKVANP
jgi:hypothetical protein